jgi:hypothetical protein
MTYRENEHLEARTMLRPSNRAKPKNGMRIAMHLVYDLVNALLYGAYRQMCTATLNTATEAT